MRHLVAEANDRRTVEARQVRVYTYCDDARPVEMANRVSV